MSDVEIRLVLLSQQRLNVKRGT